MSDRDHSQKAPRGIRKHIHRATFLTLTGTAIAIVAALTGIYTGYDAHQARLDDERPFLNVGFETPAKGEPPIPGILDIRTKAEGKSPAKDVSVLCVIALDTVPPRDWSTSGLSADTFPFLLPGQWVKPKCSLGAGYDPKNPPINATIVAMGSVQYEDTRKQYSTPFCFTWTFDPNKNLDVHACGTSRGLPDVK